MKSQRQNVEIFTVDQSPHGFYWGREEGAAGRGIPTAPQKPVVEDEVRRTSGKLIAFLKQYLK